MKGRVLAIGLMVALSALVMARWAAPASGEARISLYRRHPWPGHIRSCKRA